MSESPRTSLLVEPHDPIDSELWDFFDAIDRSTEPSFDQLKPSYEVLLQTKHNFFASGCQSAPNLQSMVSHRELLGLHNKIKELRELKNQLLSDTELEPVARQAYRWRINEEIASAMMVDASTRGDMRRFRAYNYFIYGRPDPGMFNDTVDWFRTEAHKHLEHQSVEVRQAALAVLGLLPNMDGKANNLKPSLEVFAQVKQNQFRKDGYFALALAGIEVPAEGRFTAENGNPIIEKVLKNIESGYSLAPSTGTTWSADHQKSKLEYPFNYNLALRRFLGLPIGHEARHILERVNGLRQPIRLFGGGLDRYEPGNEGRAIIGEQVNYDTFDDFAQTDRWQVILRRHLATSLADGLLSPGKELDFPATFKIINAIDKMVERVKKPQNIKAADEKAKERSWILMESVFKGTDGQGGAYGRYKLYLEGNVAIWRTLETWPELMDYGDYGKFDISNPRHIAICQAMGVIPSPE